MQERDEEAVHRQKLEATITKVCSEQPNLQIQAKVAPEDKVEKLAMVVKYSKAEVDKGQLEIHMEIVELQFQLQPTIPP